MDNSVKTFGSYVPAVHKQKDTMPLEEPDSGEPEDMVYRPSHYTQGGVETIDAIKASLTTDGFRAYCKGNVMKYVWRYENKGKPLQDLQKACTYLSWLMESIREGEQ